MSAVTDPSHVPKLPEPPPVPRRIRLRASQVAGLLLFLLLPLLALSGVFGQSVGHVEASDQRIALEVTYPERLRLKMLETLEVAVLNRTSQPIAAVELEFDRDYIARFSKVAFTPESGRVTARAQRVELTDLQPGERRLVLVEMQAERYWRSRGAVAVWIDGDAGPQVEWHTWVFP